MTMPTRATAGVSAAGGRANPHCTAEVKPDLSATCLPRRSGWRSRRSPAASLAGIGAGIAFYFGETFATIFVLDIVKYMPFAVTRASVAFGAAGRYL